MSTAKMNLAKTRDKGLPSIEGIVDLEDIVVSGGETSFTTTLFNSSMKIRGFILDGITSEVSESTVNFTDKTTFELTPAASDGDTIYMYGINSGFYSPLTPSEKTQLQDAFNDIITSSDSLEVDLTSMESILPDLVGVDSGDMVVVNETEDAYEMRNPMMPIGSIVNINAPEGTISNNWVQTNGQIVSSESYPDLLENEISSPLIISENVYGVFENDDSRPIVVGEDIVSLTYDNAQKTNIQFVVYDRSTQLLSVKRFQPFSGIQFASNNFWRPILAEIGGVVVAAAVDSTGGLVVRYTSDLGDTPWEGYTIPPSSFDFSLISKWKVVNGNLVMWRGNSVGTYVALEDFTDNTSLVIGASFANKYVRDVEYVSGKYVISYGGSSSSPTHYVFRSDDVTGTVGTDITFLSEDMRVLHNVNGRLVGIYDTKEVVFTDDVGGSWFSVGNMQVFDGSSWVDLTGTITDWQTFSFGANGESYGMVFYDEDSHYLHVAQSSTNPDRFERTSITTFGASTSNTVRVGGGYSGTTDIGVYVAKSGNENGMTIRTLEFDRGSVPSYSSPVDFAYIRNFSIQESSDNLLWATHNSSIYISSDGQEWGLVPNPTTQFGDPAMTDPRIKTIFDGSRVVVYDHGASNILYYEDEVNGILSGSWTKVVPHPSAGNITQVEWRPGSPTYVLTEDAELFITEDGLDTITTSAVHATVTKISANGDWIIGIAGTSGDTYYSYSKGSVFSFTQGSAPIGLVKSIAWYGGDIWLSGLDGTTPVVIKSSDLINWSDVTPAGLDPNDQIVIGVDTQNDRLFFIIEESTILYIDNPNDTPVSANFSNTIPFYEDDTVIDDETTKVINHGGKPLLHRKFSNALLFQTSSLLIELNTNEKYVLPNKSYNGDPTYIKVGWFPTT